MTALSDIKKSRGEVALTPVEVAERLRISERALREYLRTGRIPAIRIGKLWRITESTVDAILRGTLKV